MARLSRARPASPCPSAPAAMNATPGPPGSAGPAAPARWQPRCTTSREGRTITIGPHEGPAGPPPASARQTRPGRLTTRPPGPKSNAKIGHLMRRRHGGRRARVRGHLKVAADFALLAAAVNLARLAVLWLASHTGKLGSARQLRPGKAPDEARARPHTAPPAARAPAPIVIGPRQPPGPNPGRRDTRDLTPSRAGPR